MSIGIWWPTTKQKPRNTRNKADGENCYANHGDEQPRYSWHGVVFECERFSEHPPIVASMEGRAQHNRHSLPCLPAGIMPEMAQIYLVAQIVFLELGLLLAAGYIFATDFGLLKDRPRGVLYWCAFATVLIAGVATICDVMRRS